MCIRDRDMGMPIFAQTNTVAMNSIGDVLVLWLKSSLQIALLIIVIVTTLNILYKILDEYHLIEKLTKTIEPLLKFFGLPSSTGFLWLIGYIVGPVSYTHLDVYKRQFDDNGSNLQVLGSYFEQGLFKRGIRCGYKICD